MIIRLDRHEVCKVLLALTAVSQMEGTDEVCKKVLLALTAVSHMEGTAEVYTTVHDKIKDQLVKYDEDRREIMDKTANKNRAFPKSI